LNHKINEANGDDAGNAEEKIPTPRHRAARDGDEHDDKARPRRGETAVQFREKVVGLIARQIWMQAQILDFARTTEPKLAPVNLNELVDELGLLVRHKLANQSIKLIRDLQSSLPLVMGDAPQLEQAFLNLILNAAEAMPDGGVLTIKSREIRQPRKSAQPTHVAMEFKDTGKGMSEELQKRAFTAVLSTTKAKGTGLGLAIVGRIIETHRGTLQIKSKIGRGTGITITLPVK